MMKNVQDELEYWKSRAARLSLLVDQVFQDARVG